MTEEGGGVVCELAIMKVENFWRDWIWIHQIRGREGWTHCFNYKANNYNCFWKGNIAFIYIFEKK